jgi:redox-sensitive bicupin YhaK (pirin superfamily)
MYIGHLQGSQRADLQLDPARKAYVHLMRGALQVNGQRLETGDALLVEGESQLTFSEGDAAQVMVFDLSA